MCMIPFYIIIKESMKYIFGKEIYRKRKAELSRTKVSFLDNSRTSPTFGEESIVFSWKVGIFQIFIISLMPP